MNWRLVVYKRAKVGAGLLRPTALAMAAASLAFAIAGVTCAEGTEPVTSNELPSDLKRAMDDYDQATFRNDIEAYRELVANDYMLVNSDASLEDKEQSILPFGQPGFRIDPYVNEQPLRIVWSDGAVLGGLLRLSWTQDGKHHTRLVRTAHVWARLDGQWRLMYTQVTRVPE